MTLTTVDLWSILLTLGLGMSGVAIMAGMEYEESDLAKVVTWVYMAIMFRAFYAFFKLIMWG